MLRFPEGSAATGFLVLWTGRLFAEGAGGRVPKERCPGGGEIAEMPALRLHQNGPSRNLTERGAVHVRAVPQGPSLRAHTTTRSIDASVCDLIPIHGPTHGPSHEAPLL